VIYQYPARAVYEIREGASKLRQYVDNLEEHLRTDHAALKRVWDLHTVSKVMQYKGHPTCIGCEQIYPCETIQALIGEYREVA
jgi:hypothetical protein